MGTPPFLPQTSLAPGILGRCAGGLLALALLTSAIGSTGAVAQVTDLNVTGTTNSATYSIKATGSAAFGSFSSTVSYTSDGSATQTEIRNGLIAAAQADPVFSALVSVAAGTNKIVATATRAGADYTVTFTFPDNPSTQLTQTAVTAAADAPTYKIGRWVEQDGASGLVPTVSTPSALTEPTITYTVTHGAGATYSGTFTVETVDGSEVPVSWSASAGAALPNTLTNIETAIESAMSTAGLTGAIATVDSPDVVVSFPLGYSGLVSVTSSASGGGGSPAMTVAVDAGDAVPTYLLVRDPMDTSPYRGQTPNTLPPTNQGLPRPVPVVLGGGQRWGVEVASQSGITAGAQVYVQTAAGASNGLSTPTPSTTAAPVRVRGVPVIWAGVDPQDSTLAYVTI